MRGPLCGSRAALDEGSTIRSTIRMAWRADTGSARLCVRQIGDSRLGSMETGVGIVRAVTEAVRMGCDVINMSYGEPAALCDSGRCVGLDVV